MIHNTTSQQTHVLQTNTRTSSQTNEQVTKALQVRSRQKCTLRPRRIDERARWRLHVTPANRPTSYRRIHSRHQRRMSKTQKFFKCAHGKSAPYVHVASTNAPSHNRLTRPTRTAQQPINRPQYVGGAPRATKGTVRRGSPPRQPANTNINVSQRSRL
jgi:hypothetical protein